MLRRLELEHRHDHSRHLSAIHDKAAGICEDQRTPAIRREDSGARRPGRRAHWARHLIIAHASASPRRRYVLNQQLFHCLLMWLDRVQGNELMITLQKAELLRYARGHITVLDRLGLEQRACDCYTVVR